jgi:hypothetical protein
MVSNWENFNVTMATLSTGTGKLDFILLYQVHLHMQH